MVKMLTEQASALCESHFPIRKQEETLALTRASLRILQFNWGESMHFPALNHLVGDLLTV